LFAILAFNQEVAKTREVVSEPMLGQIRLQWWREAIDGIVAGTPRQHEVVNPLGDAFSAFALDRTAFDAILDAREADLEDAPFATLADLTDYARRTAGSLSAIELEILGVRDLATTQSAEAVSLAWSLTGLLRAIPFHARQKRLMLPAEMLESNGARIGDYHELRDREAFRAVVRSIAETASGALSDARGGSGVRFNAAEPVLLQGRLASLYLDRLETAGWNAFDPAVNAPMPMTSWSLWWASIRRRF
jgi:phytoene synthase